jgi:hypothetical protein
MMGSSPFCYATLRVQHDRTVVKENLPVRETGALPSAHVSAATVSPTFRAAQADAMLRCNDGLRRYGTGKSGKSFRSLARQGEK